MQTEEDKSSQKRKLDDKTDEKAEKKQKKIPKHDLEWVFDATGTKRCVVCGFHSRFNMYKMCEVRDEHGASIDEGSVCVAGGSERSFCGQCADKLEEESSDICDLCGREFEEDDEHVKVLLTHVGRGTVHGPCAYRILGGEFGEGDSCKPCDQEVFARECLDKCPECEIVFGEDMPKIKIKCTKCNVEFEVEDNLDVQETRCSKCAFDANRNRALSSSEFLAGAPSFADL